jgi:hypothetical protein
MRLAIYLLVLISLGHLFGTEASSQSLRTECPMVLVLCPDEGASPGKPLTFTANVKGSSLTAKLRYSWTISAGEISAGQDTSSITVDTAGINGAHITATVEVDGLPAGCPVKASCSIEVTPVIGCGRPFDQYGALDFEDEAARLDNFTIQLQSEPTAQAYIFAYDGRNGKEGQAEARANRAKNYMVKVRGADRERIFVVAGGFRDDMTFELVLVPPGVEPPEPTPTIAPEDVQTIEKPKGSKPR